MAELLIAVNPDEDSRLPLLLRVPLAGGDLLFRTSGTWPREKALFAYPVPLDEWPADPVIVERVPLRSCRRRGAAIDVIAERSRHNRSQLVFTQARGRDVVFWQSPRTRKQARPNVRTPTARAYGIEDLQIVVDSHEQYAYRFATQHVTTVKRALPCGDYGIVVDDKLVASVERKSLVDLIASLTGGKLRYQVGDLAALPRAAVVIEDRYSQLFKLDRVRPAVVADGLAELQIRWPNVPVVFCETRQLAEEWTYRFLAAAHAWAITEQAARNASHPSRSASSKSISPHRWHRPPRRSAPGPAALGCRYPIAGGSGPRSGLPGTTPTRRTEPSAHGPVLCSTTRSGSTPVTRKEVCIKPGMFQYRNDTDTETPCELIHLGIDHNGIDQWEIAGTR